MKSLDDNSMITRRGLLQRVAGICASCGVLSLVGAATAEASLTSANDAKSDSALVPGKIALEEHFVIPETLAASYGAPGSAEFQQRLADLGSARIAEMDRGGLDLCILSLVGDGIQAIPNVPEAIRIARRANDHLAEQIAKNPKRFKGFAALPLQDPQAAALELTRCVEELGFCGALVNGYSQINTLESTVFYDLPQYRDFWATVQQLDVPFYLHPRSASAREPAYEGHRWLTGSVWGFAAETSIHALRLMGSGLFDDYPSLKIILGHLGEGLPCNIWRIDNRVSRTLGAKPSAKRPIVHYLRENFYITTSGNFRTPTLTEVVAEVGADRVLYSVDFPFEDTAIAADWFDHAAISDSDREKIGRGNAQRLFHL
jgi:predicted TIM-barrel fold metal-dependent hydrolase